jgi:hypothetical protein
MENGAVRTTMRDGAAPFLSIDPLGPPVGACFQWPLEPIL